MHSRPAWSKTEFEDSQDYMGKTYVRRKKQTNKPKKMEVEIRVM